MPGTLCLRILHVVVQEALRLCLTDILDLLFPFLAVLVAVEVR